MNRTQFQVESRGAGPATQVVAERLKAIASPEISDAEIESLMLAFYLRGWPARSEKSLLERLSNHDRSVFLIGSDGHCHPTDSVPFPPELITPTAAQNGEALFRHHFRPASEMAGTGYTIHSAVINPDHPTPLILGMFGPRSSFDEGVIQTDFTALAAQFREAAGKAQTRAAEIASRLGKESATILINRCSGRIIHVTPRAAASLGEVEDQLVDLEYGAFKSRVAAALTRCKLKLTNFDCEGALFTLLDLSLRSGRPVATELSLEEHFVHRLRNKMSSVMTAASHLKSVAGTNTAPEVSELADILISETGQAERILSRYNLLANFEKMPAVACNPISELKQAVRQAGQACPAGSINLTAADAPVSFTAPASALTTLFETSLLAHLDQAGSAVVTDVTPRFSQAAAGLSVTLNSRGDSRTGNTALRQEWLEYAGRLAEKMGLAIDCSISDQGNLFTRIDIPVRTTE